MNPALNTRSPLFVHEDRGGGGGFEGDGADPVGGEGGGEFVFEGLAGLDGEGGVGAPLAGAGDVHFDADGDGFGVVVGEDEAFAVVAGHEVGVRGDAGLDARLVPGAALAAGFTELPEVVGDAEPERGFSAGGPDDAAGGRLFQVDAAQHEQAAPGAVVVDGEVVGGDGADEGEAAGIDGREFIEGAMGVEEVAFGDDFTGEAHALGEFGIVEGGVALGQTPAAALVVGVEDRGRVHFEDAGGRGDVLAHPGFEGGIRKRFKLEGGIQAVEAGV